ncbi:MAG TPA: hypothetical protein VGJ70_16100 [Solirubrobacteraceae bacterium]
MQPARIEVGPSPSADVGRTQDVRRGRRGLARSAGRWLGERRLVLAVGLAASIPIIVSVIRTLDAGWVPMSDDALISMKALDVLTAHPPLLGPWSSGYSAIVHEPTFHPGPMLFWLLALPVRIFDPDSLIVTVGLVNVASAMGIVALADRRGGRPLMIAAAIAIPVMTLSLPPDAFAAVWNPSAALLPFGLLLFLCWSLACGEHRLLPLAVLVASFAPQCHLSFAVPVAGTLVVGVVGLALARRALPRDRPDDRRSLRRWLVAAVAVGLVCWSAPLVDQVVHRPGNMVLLGRAVTAHQEKVGSGPAWRATVHAVGVMPWWLQEPRVGLARVIDLVVDPGAVAIASAALILAALVALIVVAARRGRGDVVAGCALGLVVAAAAALVTAAFLVLGGPAVTIATARAVREKP